MRIASVKSLKALTMLVVTALAAAPLSLLAQDLTLKQTIVSTGAMMMGGMDKTTATTTYFSQRALRVDSEMGPTTLILFDEEKLVSIDHNRKTYSEVSFKQMQESMAKLVAEMKKNKEQYEAMRKMMGGTSSTFVVEATGPGETIAGFRTEKYRLKGPWDMEIWAAPDLPAPALYYDAMKMRMPSNPIFDFGKMYDEMKKIQGMTLKTVQVINMMGREMKTVTEVTAVEKGPVPAEKFQLPVGYKLEAFQTPQP